MLVTDKVRSIVHVRKRKAEVLFLFLFCFGSHVFDSPCGETEDRFLFYFYFILFFVVICSIVHLGRRKTEVLFFVVMRSIAHVGRRKA